MKIHTILILAGGDGTRFYPLENKMRFPFNGKTVLQHIVHAVKEYAEHIVVVTSVANKELIQSDLSTYSVEYALQTKDEGGMADAILAAKSLLSKDMLVLNANDVFDFSVIPQLVELTVKEGSPVGIVAKHMSTYFPGGYVVFQGETVVELLEKPGKDNTPSSYVRLVADYFPHADSILSELHSLPASDDKYEQAITALIKRKPASCLKYEGDWATLKYSWHVLAMQEYMLGRLATASDDMADSAQFIHKTAVIEGNVVMGKNVKIGAYTKISGPCFIGENVIIGDHSLIRNSTICDNALVGSGCEVARSYLGRGVMLHRNYVGDSILADDVTMGAGGVTANYRFDTKEIQSPIQGKLVETGKKKLGLIAGKGAHLGVNVSTYPGVKIASGTMILPGEVVMKDR